MHHGEPVVEIHADRAVRARARRVYFASGVDRDPTRCTSTLGSSGLYPTQPWRPLHERVVWAKLDGTELPGSIAILTIENDLYDRLRVGIVDRCGTTGASGEQPLPAGVATGIEAALDERLPGTWAIDDVATVLRGWSSNEISGDGLAFDDGPDSGLTMSVNTGDAARFVHFAVEDRDEITWYDQQPDIYNAAAALNPTIYAVEIHPSEAWLLTGRRLHDNRPAEPDRFTSVVTLRAEQR